MFCSIAYTALNDHESAMECYRKALDLDPTNQSYQNNLEIAEQKLKEEAAKVGYCSLLSAVISCLFHLKVWLYDAIFCRIFHPIFSFYNYYIVWTQKLNWIVSKSVGILFPSDSQIRIILWGL